MLGKNVGRIFFFDVFFRGDPYRSNITKTLDAALKILYAINFNKLLKDSVFEKH